MKKILFSLLICLCANLTISAQIQRTFFGLTLGVSTRSDVERFYKEHVVALKKDSDEYIVANKEWGGNEWDIVSLLVFDDKFYAISFLDSEITTDKSVLEKLWDKYSNSFYSKYSQYYINEQSQSDHSFYSDNNTYLNTRFTKISDKFALSIIYSDSELEAKKRDKENSDL